jgi:hypothetical protein
MPGRFKVGSGYTSVLGLSVAWRDGSNCAVLVNHDGLNIAFACRDDHPCPGEVVLRAKSTDIWGALRAMVDDGDTVIAAPAVGAHEISALVKTTDGLYVSVYEPIS